MYYGRHFTRDGAELMRKKWTTVFRDKIKMGLTKHPKFAVNIEHKNPKPKGEIMTMSNIIGGGAGTMGGGGPSKAFKESSQNLGKSEPLQREGESGRR